MQRKMEEQQLGRREEAEVSSKDLSSEKAGIQPAQHVTSSSTTDAMPSVQHAELIARQSEAEASTTAGLLSSSRTSSSSSLPGNQYGSKNTETGDMINTDRLSQAKDKGGKKERTLRKGKWTVEEEEYTSRIIHYFNSGLLSLPDGATLRSYLAEKLNCDPMRITKKYAGAACLGRRAQHFRDRAQPMVAEIQLARAELDHLERRFRMRVEEGHSSLPLPPPTDLLQSLANVNRLMLPKSNDSSQALFQSWLMGMAGQQQPQPPIPAVPPAPLGVQPSWLLPNSLGNPLNPGNPLQPWAQPPSVSSGVDATMANWAFAQAAASLAPAITQLATENLRQQQQQQQQELQQRLKQVSDAESVKEYTRQLQHSFEQQLKKSVTQMPSTNKPTPTVAAVPPPEAAASPAVVASSAPAPTTVIGTASIPVMNEPQVANPPSQKEAPPVSRKQLKRKSDDDPATTSFGGASVNQQTGGNKCLQRPKARTEEDKQAGSILLGFLSSLRHSYEEALEKERDAMASGSTSLSVTPTMMGASSNGAESEGSYARNVTDSSGMSSSQNFVESSVEDSDWNSDKKADPSSSEESDKEPQSRHLTSKGPPRKRLKTQRSNELGSSTDSNKWGIQG